MSTERRVPRQWKVIVEVHAPLAEVWEAVEDVSLIPAYHPDVRQVELLSGTARRAPGMSYKCIVPSGRRAGWCVEQVIEHVPLQRTTVAFPADSWGLTRLLGDFTTELSVASPGRVDRTRVELTAYYRPQGWRGRLLNRLGLRWLMRTRARQTLNNARQLIEARHAGLLRLQLMGNPLGGQAMIYTEADFDHLSWHDCHIWGVDLHAGDPDEKDWTSDLALDLDFIVEWICGVEGVNQFRVAPASLVFHGVTDPKINIDWGRSGLQIALHSASIDHVERELVHNQKVYLNRPYYRWTMRLNWPEASEIAFGAVGFTQTLRADPILTQKQCLSFRERSRLRGK